GGNTQLAAGSQTVGAGTVMTARLVVRKAGRTLDASMQPLPSTAGLVHVSPPFSFTAELSGDGHYLFVVPDGLLTPGQHYTIKLAGNYTAQGVAIGNLHAGGTTLGNFSQALDYQVRPAGAPLQVAAGG